MLKFSEIFEFSRENSYFERIRMVRMVRMVRSLADRTFQLWAVQRGGLAEVHDVEAHRLALLRARDGEEVPLRVAERVRVVVHEELVLEHLGDLYAESGQTCKGSFSAVSTPIFASKYSLESSRRDLHDALLCTVLQSQNFR